MSYSTENRRMKPVLDTARQFDVADNPAPEAIFESGSAGFQIWCTPENHPQGWNDVPMDAGTFCKPCAYVSSVHWGWEGESITHLVLSTDAYALREHLGGSYADIHNRPEDIAWATCKIRWLFTQAGVTVPAIRTKD